MLDDQRHAAVSIGNPDTATRTATLVPGTGQDMAAFTCSDGKSLDMYNATMQADRSLRAGDVAVTTWMGYDRPMDLAQAASSSYANNGAGALDSYLAGVQASHDSGYHWPSILSSVTATDRPWSGLPVPVTTTWPLTMSSRSAVRVGHASDLNLDPGGHVYATRAQHDIIHLVAGAALGPNPTWDGFGAVELKPHPAPRWGRRSLTCRRWLPIAATGTTTEIRHYSTWGRSSPVSRPRMSCRRTRGI